MLSGIPAAGSWLERQRCGVECRANNWGAIDFKSCLVSRVLTQESRVSKAYETNLEQSYGVLA
eukprot:scaffold160391_cov14-Tisochrysis_lutea.AAC.2